MSNFSRDSIIHSLTGIFTVAYVFNIAENSTEELISSPEVHEFYAKNINKNINDILAGMAKIIALPESIEKMQNFLDVSTLPERLKDRTFLKLECRANYQEWIRVLLLPVQEDAAEEINEFIFITYPINEEIEKENRLLLLSETDGLTKLLNRSSYENECQKLSEKPLPSNLVLICFDLNELKVVNDSFGHAAGDEIIKGLSECLTKTFSDFGKIYRTGGDEFIVLANISLNELERTLMAFDAMVADWEGKLIKDFSVSKGYSSVAEDPDSTIQELVRIADKRMYAAKSEFYKETGKNRRKERLDGIVISKILERENIGIWSIEIDEDKPPRMYADRKMKDLLGVTDETTPEETYEFWYKRIHPDYYDSVNDSVEKMTIGNHAEVQYPWNHPQRGKIYVRCGGVRDTTYTTGIRLEGSHQNVTNMIHLQKDSLTDLYTREFFYQRAQEIMDQNPDKDYRFFIINVENFKLVNEKYGVEEGDKLLRYIASAGKRYYPNLIMSGRLSADRFICMQRPVTQTREEGLELERKIMKDIPLPNITLRYGIYYTTFDKSVNVQTMCDRANLAVESIKGSYSRKCAVYDDKLQDKIHKNHDIVENMQAAIDNREFKVYLQPKHDLRTNKTGGAEALVRWIHPKLGFMSPGEFIPIFENNGFIKSVDAYIFIEVLKLLRKWLDQKLPVVPISINLSRRDFEHENYAQKINEAVDQYGIPHNLLHFELTESAISDNPKLIVKCLTELHNYGYMIELDDFGAGYASLVTLSEIDFDILKLDMSIIKNDNPASKRNVLDLCSKISKDMDLKSVAEGVETEEQVERIRSLGCDYVQGFFYSKPLPIEEFEKYLLKN